MPDARRCEAEIIARLVSMDNLVNIESSMDKLKNLESNWKSRPKEADGSRHYISKQIPKAKFDRRLSSSLLVDNENDDDDRGGLNLTDSKPL